MTIGVLWVNTSMLLVNPINQRRSRVNQEPTVRIPQKKMLACEFTNSITHHAPSACLYVTEEGVEPTLLS
jgi:hypothetical protein